MSFDGFRTESFELLDKLAANNTAEWFAEHAEEYESLVRAPMRQLVEELRGLLIELSPLLQPSEIPDQHLSEIERRGDAIPGAGPYNTNCYAYFWNRTMARLTDGNLHIGLSSKGVSLGFSIYEFARSRRARLSQIFVPRLRTDLALLDDYIKANYLRRGYQFHRYARAPGRLGLKEVEAFPMQPSEWEDSLGWVVSRHIHTESSRLTPGSFLTEVGDSFRKLYPLYLFTSDPRLDWKRAFRKFL
jgi:uncharacterized protein (DUF2461 family)